MPGIWAEGYCVLSCSREIFSLLILRAGSRCCLNCTFICDLLSLELHMDVALSAITFNYNKTFPGKKVC